MARKKPLHSRTELRLMANRVRDYFKMAFYDAMQKYAPVADGWLRSCGMFKVVAKLSGGSVIVSVIEAPNRSKNSIYWREVEKGSTLPPGFRMWCEADGGPRSRGMIVRQVFKDRLAGASQNRYYYWERRVYGGTWESARVTRFQHPALFSRFDAEVGRERMHISNAYRRKHSIGDYGSDRRRFWVTKKAIKRKGVPFMDAVCADAVAKTRAAIAARELDTFSYDLSSNIKIDEKQRAIALRRYRTVVRREARTSEWRYRQAGRAYKRDDPRRKAELERFERSREAQEQYEKNLREAARAGYMAEWRQKMMEDPKSWKSPALRQAEAEERAKAGRGGRYDAYKINKMQSRERDAFEKRFGFSPEDVGVENARAAGEDPWEHMSRWW